MKSLRASPHNVRYTCTFTRCEWLILAHIYTHTTKGMQTFGRRATLWIWLVMFGILLIPDVLKAFAFEEVPYSEKLTHAHPALPCPAICVPCYALQPRSWMPSPFHPYQVFGLWPDFQLCLSSWYLAARFKDANTDAFRYFKYAATFHLAQIFTLLFQGLGFLPPWPTAQFLIMFTAFFNYYYYTRFALELDAWNFGEEALADEEADNVEVGESKQPSNANGTGKGKRAAYQSIELFPTKERKIKFAFLCICFSTVSVLGPLVAFDNCVRVHPDPAHHPAHEPNVRLTRYEISDEMSVDVKTRRKLLNSVIAKRDKPNNVVARLYTNEKEFVVYEWWNGTFSDKPFSDNGLPVTSVLTGYAQSNPDEPEYVPPSLENELLSGDKWGTSRICQSKARSGYTIIDAKDSYKDAVAIKVVAEAGFSRTSTNDFYLSAVGSGVGATDSTFFILETWKSNFDFYIHMMKTSVIRLAILAEFMAKSVEYGKGFHEIDVFRHC